MKRKIVLVIAVFAISVISLISLYIFRETETNISNSIAEHKLSAIELFKKFEEDENQANMLYLGKIIEISGTIISIDQTENHETMLIFRESDEIFGVLCTLAKTDKNKKKLVVGKKVKLKGVCKGYLSDVIVNNCIIIGPS